MADNQETRGGIAIFLVLEFPIVCQYYLKIPLCARELESFW